ncbi:type I phosphomannose isomerase catalytic subunit [Flavobacterium microcysteis]|uniref:Phosphohexomutase n=1 Tax=Flavobacterium microcysteis TaxID=2596891 RepID=A0A501QBD2_9FLAO|nr:type I phosphomannose isomerase catalytic subunit [Flavobacterium microcysteis]TPD69728.1 class I mannose-6-phosphate isomerase [Flavobacterium microcysteis]
MSLHIYPLVFEPILKERIWGGTKLKTVFDKPIQSETTGESWELSTVPGDISRIAVGEYKGKLLSELISQYPEEILGKTVHRKFGTEFPLLFKFIDAKDDLSIQVHPNDELAKKRHNSFGKTEMWYVMQADENAKIVVGFKEKSSKEKYLKNLENKTLLSILEEITVKKGDVFFLETGTIHAIGAGIVIAEIQQTSDITYRVYDWDRVDAEGKSRELHIDLALDAINYDRTDTKRTYTQEENKSNPVVICPYFTTDYLPLNGKIEIKKQHESFTVYMCMEGDFKVKYNETVWDYKKGDTVLLPAAMQEYELEGQAVLLEIYI